MKSLEGKDGLLPVDLGDGSEDSLKRLGQLRPEVAIVDLPSGRLTRFVREVHEAHHKLPVIAVNCDESDSEIIELFEAGLTGFVSHEANLEELVGTIREVLRGEFDCPPRIGGALVRRVNAAGQHAEVRRVQNKLTPRETQIARLLERSLTNKEIASRLGLEVATVRNHVHSIFQKLNAHRRSEISLHQTPPNLRAVRERSPRSRRP